MVPPVPPGYPRGPESFQGYTGLTFDPQGAVEAAANLTASLLFEPTRASRLVEYHARDAAEPGLEEVIDQTLQTTWEAPRQSGPLQQTEFTVQTVVLQRLLRLAVSRQASPQARAITLARLADLESWLTAQLDGQIDAPDSSGVQAHWSAALDDLEQFWKDPQKFEIAPPLPTPPGQPIGSDEDPRDFELD
jgi:hypothetical protein